MQYGYHELLAGHLRAMLRNVLTDIENDGLLGDQHLYIVFKSAAKGVKIPDFLKKQFPDELTIVIQHRYWNLKVKGEKFSIQLAFNGKVETLTVPFNAILSFVDPSTGFGISFETLKEELATVKDKIKSTKPSSKESKAGESKAINNMNNVLQFQNFRQK